MKLSQRHRLSALAVAIEVTYKWHLVLWQFERNFIANVVTVSTRIFIYIRFDLKSAHISRNI